MENNKKKTKKLLWLISGAAAALLALVLLLPAGEQAQPAAVETMEPVTTAAAEETQPKGLFLLQEALRVDTIADYTGIYVEDGSDEAVTDLLMMIVTNVTEAPIQYAEISLDLGEKTAEFTVSSLPAGGSAVLIEQNRMMYDPSVDYTAVRAECSSLAGYNRELSLQEDKLQIQLLDGGVNIQNISGSDIPETIVLYYKNISNGVYHGGITYRVRLEGGLKAGELRQIMVEHIHSPGSQLMFVEILE